MRKCFPILAVAVFAVSILNGAPANARNFSTGALFNSEWTCINQKLSKGGPISETKVAELQLSPYSRSTKNSVTTVRFNKLNLNILRGSFTKINVFVFDAKKTYSRSMLNIKNQNGDQKVSFSTQVPSGKINEIVFNITIQNLTEKDSAASCIPTSIYQSMLPVAQPSPIPSPNPSQGTEPISKVNPVLAKINKMISQLEFPKSTVAPPVEWVFSSGTNVERLESLKQQHQRFSEAFPTLYFWEKPALAVVSSDVTWLRVEMENAGCQDGVIEFLRRLEADKKLTGAGTSVCRGRMAAFFLDRNMTDLMWSNLVGSEFGGAIQENSFKKSPSFKSGNFNWYSSAPSWYAEGGQTVLSVIASTKISRNWSHQGRQLAQVNPYCFDDTLTSSKCAPIGEAGVELLITLYGWDSAFIWFENMDNSKTLEISFLETFKDPYEKFQGWALAYYRYLTKGEPLPNDLLIKLAS
jgi:hypothetical protein